MVTESYRRFLGVSFLPMLSTLVEFLLNVEDTDANCIQAYHSFLCMTSVAENCIPEFANELDQTQQQIEENANTDI